MNEENEWDVEVKAEVVQGPIGELSEWKVRRAIKAGEVRRGDSAESGGADRKEHARRLER